MCVCVHACIVCARACVCVFTVEENACVLHLYVYMIEHMYVHVGVVVCVLVHVGVVVCVLVHVWYMWL